MYWARPTGISHARWSDRPNRSKTEFLLFISRLMDLDFDLNLGNEVLQKKKIHIRFHQSGRRAITLIEGFEEDLDLKRISRALKKLFNCACSIHVDKDENEIIKLQGNHCAAVRDWIVEQEIIGKTEAADRIVIHGG